MKLGNGDAQYDRQYLEIIQQSGDSNRVLTETDAVIATGQKTWWLYRARGQARAKLGDKSKAAEEFDQAVLADESKDIDGATKVFEAIADALGYDAALQKLAGRINTDDQWRLLAMRFRAATNDWKGAAGCDPAVSISATQWQCLSVFSPRNLPPSHIKRPLNTKRRNSSTTPGLSLTLPIAWL